MRLFRNRRTTLARQMLHAVLIVLVCAGVGMAFNAVRPHSLPWVQDWDKTLAERARDELNGSVSVIELDRMVDLYQKEDVVVLDARSEAFFDFEHIPGARNMPVELADERLPQLLDQLAPAERIVTYCDGPTCPAAEQLARKIVARSQREVLVFVGGISAWMAAGREVASSDGGG